MSTMKKRHYVLRKSNNAWVQDAYGKYSIKNSLQSAKHFANFKIVSEAFCKLR